METLTVITGGRGKDNGRMNIDYVGTKTATIKLMIESVYSKWQRIIFQ